MNTDHRLPSIPSYRALRRSIPSSVQLRRALRRNAYLPGRPYAYEDSRVWMGLLIGLGVGAAATALLDARVRTRVREGIRGASAHLRALASRGRQDDGKTLGASASSIEESIEIAVPVERAYEQWMRFEELPKFMEGVVSVRRDPVNERSLHWEAQIAGAHREWDAEITEQSENQRVAWCSTSGAHNAGVVTFHRLRPNRCKVMLQMDYEPEGAMAKAGDQLGVLRRRVRGDLARFRDYMEQPRATR